VTVGYVGRLSPEKGVDRLLQAAALVLARRPNTKFILAGSGPEDARLKRMAETLGLTKNVTFLSQVDEVSEVYASLDMVVLPSLTEGLPLMVLEALAAKRAVVATNVGAVPQVIIDGETGLLVAPGDVNALAAGIERLMEDSSLRNRLASRGHSLVAQSYSVNVMTAGYLALYHDTVQLKHNSMNGGSKFDLSATNDAVV
jgi:glycosyltransferase involved in cell wall biosynthesis